MVSAGHSWLSRPYVVALLGVLVLGIVLLDEGSARVHLAEERDLSTISTEDKLLTAPAQLGGGGLTGAGDDDADDGQDVGRDNELEAPRPLSESGEGASDSEEAASAASEQRDDDDGDAEDEGGASDSRKKRAEDTADGEARAHDEEDDDDEESEGGANSDTAAETQGKASAAKAPPSGEAHEVTVEEAAIAQLKMLADREAAEEADARDEAMLQPVSAKAAKVPSWYSPKQRYFVYQPSGGISNQRKILEWALRVCQVLDRVCVVPPIGPHTTWFYKYNEVPIEDCAPAPTIMDTKVMRELVPVAFLDTTLVDFTRAHLNKLGGTWRVVERTKLREKIYSPWSADDVSSFFYDEPAQFLYFAKGTMWRNFNFTRDEMESVMAKVRFHPTLRTAARKLSLALGKYNALHIRFSDGEPNKVRADWLNPSSTFVYRMRLAKFHEYSSSLYVATVPSKITHPYFNRIKAAFNVTFSSALMSSDVVQTALKPFAETMKPIALGVIEQHVCARANKFLGTGFSTFSEHIREMRRLRMVAHDPEALSPSAPSAVRASEEAFLRAVTPCWRETKPC